MKKILAILSIILLTAPFASSAHVLKSDGSIGVLVHVDPDDDPIVGQPASFHVEITDKDKKFSPSGCTCTVNIIRSGQTIYTAGIYDSSTGFNNNQAYFTFSFPQKDVYKLVFTGTPIDANSFHSFNVSFDYRVSRESGQPASESTTSPLRLIIGGVLIAVVVFGVVYLLSKRPTNPNL